MELTNHKPFNRTSVETPSSAVRALTQPSLKDWLELSWFFPPEFGRESISESVSHYFVHGESLTYRFKKPSLSARQHLDQFDDRWKESVLTILENSRFAPGTYLGVQVFHWVDDELAWGERYDPSVLDPNAPPAGDEVAILMHRFERSSFLHEQEISDLSPATLSRLGSFLARRMLEIARDKPIAGDPDLESAYEQEILPNDEVLHLLVEEAASADDPTLLSLALDLRSLLNLHRDQISSALIARWERGLIVEGHGALIPAHVILTDDGAQPRFIGRIRSARRQRLRDIVADAARLDLELQLRGGYQSSRLFRQSFAERLGTAYDQSVYQFWKCEAAVRVALNALQQRHYSEARRVLAEIFRELIIGDTPYCFVVEGAERNAAADLAYRLALLTNTDFIGLAQYEDEEPSIPGTLPQEVRLSFVREKLSRKLSVVLECEPLPRDERLGLIELCRQQRAKVAFLQHASTVDNIASLRWEEEILGEPISHFRFERSIESSRLAHLLAHQIRGQVKANISPQRSVVFRP